MRAGKMEESESISSSEDTEHSTATEEEEPPLLRRRMRLRGQEEEQPTSEDELLPIRRRRRGRSEEEEPIGGDEPLPIRRRRRDTCPEKAGLDTPTSLEGSHWLCRIVLLRALALPYCAAFWVAFSQNTELIGDGGLLPCKLHLESIKHYFGGKIGMDALSYAPTLFWFLPWTSMDLNLNVIAFLGLVISAYILVTGCANMVCMALLWIFYLSLINVGQVWYAFGSDTLLLETGFLGIFLCPLWTLAPLPARTPTSRIVIWAFRWLLFRLMLGVGINKLVGDPCWRDFTCMRYHYETQPLPTPASYYLHQMPWVQVFLVFTSHVFELIVPFLMILGRRMCALHGVLQISFQVLQILSGNLGFLNWLTIVPSVACFDDASIGVLFPSGNGTIKDQVLRLESGRAARSAIPGQNVPLQQVAGTRQLSAGVSSRLQQELADITTDMYSFITGDVANWRRWGFRRGRDEQEAVVRPERPAAMPVPEAWRQSGYWTRNSGRGFQGAGQPRGLNPYWRAPAWRRQTSERMQAGESPQSSEGCDKRRRRTSGRASSSGQGENVQADKLQGRTLRQYVNIGLAVLLAYLSVPALQSRLMSPQVRETVFSPLRIVNTYSTFSRVTKVRTEIVFQGTSSPDPTDPSAVWEEYEFKCKPGDLKRRPCVLGPFQYRLDWLMWYAALQTYEQHEWVIHLAGKLLANGNITSLFELNPFMGKEPPRWIRGEHFRYKFSQRGGKHAQEGKWWHRKRIGPYFPPVNLEGLKRFFQERGWAHPPQA